METAKKALNRKVGDACHKVGDPWLKLSKLLNVKSHDAYKKELGKLS